MIEVKGEKFKTEEEARKEIRESALREAMIDASMADFDKIADNAKVVVELPVVLANAMYAIGNAIKDGYLLVSAEELEDLRKKGEKK